MDKSDNDRICFSIKDVSQKTGISRSTIYEAIKCGDLTKYKIGSRSVILRDDLVAWIKREK